MGTFSDFYATGTAFNSSGIKVPGYWKNGVWRSVASYKNNRDASANAILVSGEDVYLGGVALNTTGTKLPVLWKNGVLSVLDSIDANLDSIVTSLAISGNDVYAGGYSTLALNEPDQPENVEVAAYWRNAERTDLPYLYRYWASRVNALYVSEGRVVASGYSTDSSNTKNAGYWDNAVWVSLPQLARFRSAVVNSTSP